MKVSVFIATSLDGFIAREDDSLDWLDQANKTVPAGEDCGYAAFMSSVDLLVMGRGTYEKVLTFGDWPYQKPVIVLSSQALNIPESLASRVEHSSETPQAIYKRLSEQRVKRIYLDGGITIQRFMAAGLLDDLTITSIPIILGKGKPLFAALNRDIPLTLVSSRSYPFGFVQTTYVCS
jgi:dihydrofolate reductase